MVHLSKTNILNFVVRWSFHVSIFRQGDVTRTAGWTEEVLGFLVFGTPPGRETPIFSSLRQNHPSSSHISLARGSPVCSLPAALNTQLSFLLLLLATLYSFSHSTNKVSRWPNQETKRREPRSSRPNALNATLSKVAELTSRDPTSTDSGDVNLDRRMDIRTRVPIRRVVLCGEKIHFLIIWRILRSTSR